MANPYQQIKHKPKTKSYKVNFSEYTTLQAVGYTEADASVTLVLDELSLYCNDITLNKAKKCLDDMVYRYALRFIGNVEMYMKDSKRTQHKPILEQYLQKRLGK